MTWMLYPEQIISAAFRASAGEFPWKSQCFLGRSLPWRSLALR
jgi:hypothetical protein